MINITTVTESKRVNKPWGYELWLESNSESPYVVKILHIDAGQRISLQAHANKLETMIITSGQGHLHLSDHQLDTERWERNEYSAEEKLALLESIRQVPISEGSLLTIHPGDIHRVSALTDLDMIECSTNYLMDVIRISDDSQRPSGHIETEHL